MNLIDILIKAKEGDENSINCIVQKYNRYINNQMIKYNIIDKDDCKTNVETRIIRAIDKFKL